MGKYEIECGEPLLEYKEETIAFEEVEKRRRKYLRQKIPFCFIFEFHLAGNILWYDFVHIYLNHDQPDILIYVPDKINISMCKCIIILGRMIIWTKAFNVLILYTAVSYLRQQLWIV